MPLEETYTPHRHKLSGPLRWAYQFRVMGKGQFPFDMLRYDSCFPYSSEDAVRLDCFILSDRREIRTVNLVHYSDSATWTPTEGRWNSFLWKVADA